MKDTKSRQIQSTIWSTSKKETNIKRTKGNDLARYHIPARKLKPSKRLHSLSTNIALSQQNAGKWQYAHVQPFAN